MAKKKPLRKCVVTGEMHPKETMFRVVLSPEKEVFIDESHRANGRGAYLQKKREIIEKAKKTGVLNRSLRVKVPEEIYEELLYRLD